MSVFFQLVSKFPLCCSVYQHFVPFNCWIVFHCMHIQPFVHLSPIERHVDCFHFLTVVDNVAMNISIQFFVWMDIHFHFSLVNIKVWSWWTQLFLISLFKKNMSIYGCAVSSLLSGFFSSCGVWGYSLVEVCGLLTAVVSLVAEPGL